MFTFSQSFTFGKMRVARRVFSAGFTLIELLVVIAIIALLASMILVNLQDSRAKGRVAKARVELDQIYLAIQLLLHDTGQWPGHKSEDAVEPGVPNNEIWDLSGDTNGLTGTDGNYPKWEGPYMQYMPKDPWGNSYFLDTDYDIDPSVAGVRNAAVLGSFGPNGVGQNLYDADDVIKIIKSS